jgi:cysteinyl-tRNA synthetase
LLRLYNTLTKAKQPFKPLAGKRVRMYVCGVTVYDYCHLGHARSALLFDMLRRYLLFKGYRVTYVKNFTDVDDKIINRAQQEHRGWQEVAQVYTAAYREDMARLGVGPADQEPIATEHIDGMIALISKLITKKLAYRVGGDVYYRVSRFGRYGKLSRRRLNEMLAGARVEVDARKENPLDFVLWKASKHGEPAWSSPWGHGRPGWHVECSVMSMECLKSPTLDIHGGGQDLIFPHHENEIAQSEGATGKPFSRFWVHNGFVTVDKEKMSKSLGNFFTIREIFDKLPVSLNEASKREILRYFLLSAHYRARLDFSDHHLLQAKAALDNYYNMAHALMEAEGRRRAGTSTARTKRMLAVIKAFSKKFESVMDDDLNVPKALAHFQQLITATNRYILAEGHAVVLLKVRALFHRYGAVLMGLFTLEPAKWSFQQIVVRSAPAAAAVTPEEVDALVNEREQARKEENFARADDIRRQLAASGVVLEDRPDGTTRVKR